MAARAHPDPEREDFTGAINRFAHALCAREHSAQGFPTTPLEDAVQHALGAAERAGEGAQARIAAYRALIHSLIDQGESGEAPRAPSRMAPAGREPLALAGQRRAPGADRIPYALASLEPLERAVLLLVGLERLAYAEAAAALDLSVEDLMAALARARVAFAARLAAGAQGRPRLRLVE